jgi:hypothetical protein
MMSNGNKQYPRVASHLFDIYDGTSRQRLRNQEADGRRGTSEEREETPEKKEKWEYEKRFVSNGNERYPTVASRFFKHLLLDTKVKVKELRVDCKERQSQGRRREVREEEDMKI